MPEFDGRIITVPFSFKEIDDDGLISYVADPERCARVAGLAVRHARLRQVAPADKRVALVFSAYPTKHARIGNAVGLDTPASAVALLQAMRQRGYRVGDLPGVESNDGDALIHALIECGGHDPDWLTEGQLAGNPIRVSAKEYRDWFATLPAELTDVVTAYWGPPPGELFVDRSHDPDGEIVIAALRAGNLVLMVQPPRGFGENPVAIYHDPDLPPSHHYLAAYRWLDTGFSNGFGAHAVVHLGKHGNLEWLPGKTLGMSASCGPDAALGDLPLIYPFLVNDPGEGTQAKRRARGASRPFDSSDGPRRNLRRHRAFGTVARRACQRRRAGSRQAARHPPADLDADPRRQDGPRPGTDRTPGRGLVRRHAATRRRLAVRDQGRPDPRRAAHPRANPTGSKNSTWCWPSCGPASCSAARTRSPACGRHSAWPRMAPTNARQSTRPRRKPANWSRPCRPPAGTPPPPTDSPATPTPPRCCGSPPPK